MRFSAELNGFWEEGYHYYIEIRNSKMTVRDYARRVMLETKISYDAKALEDGLPTVIGCEKNVLSRTAYGEPMTWIEELRFDGGVLKMHYEYTIMGRSDYVLKKVNHGPFDHILIRDQEVLPRIVGEWVKWDRKLTASETMKITKGRKMKFFYRGSEVDTAAFHAVSYNYDPKKILLVPEVLTDHTFGRYGEFTFDGRILTTYEQITDVSVPATVFMRREDLGVLDVPDEAKKQAINLMVDRVPVDEPAKVKRPE